MKAGDDSTLTDFLGGWLSSVFVPVGGEAPAAGAGSRPDRRLSLPAGGRALPFAARWCSTPVVSSDGSITREENCSVFRKIY